MTRFSDQVRDELGEPISDVSVYVYEWDYPSSSTGALSALTDDDLTTALPNPLTTDEFGQYYFNSTDGLKLIELHYGGKLFYRQQVILTPTGFYPGNDAALRNDLAASAGAALVGTTGGGTVQSDISARPTSAALAAPTGFTLIMYRSSQSGAFARSGGAWAAVGGIDDNNLFNFIDPLLDASILAKTITTSLDTYIQAALNSGRSLRAVAGLYPVAQTLLMSANGAGLLAPPGGNLHDVGAQIVAPAELKWIGASGGTIVQIKSGGTQYPSGNRLEGFFLNGNSGLAAVATNMVGCRDALIDISAAHCTTALLKMDPDTTLSEPQGCTENYVRRLTGYQTTVGDGAHLLQTSTSTYNCSQNRFGLISGAFRQGYAIDIQGSDGEKFEMIKLFATATGAVGVRFKAGATIQQTARNNLMDYLAVTPAAGLTIVPAIAEGTGDGTVASIANKIRAYDDQNNPTLPVVHTGATLFWEPISAPNGLRSYTAAVGSQVQQDASGKITQSGISNSLAAGATQVITFAKALTTGVIAVSVTPKTAATTFLANASATQLTITNGTGATTDFYWRVEGY